MTKTVKLIFNPTANLGRAWSIAAALRPVVAEFGGADWTGTVFPTHAAELARQAAEDGYQRVIALGGDGTVHEVVNGLMQIPAEHRPALGVVPLGTGNDFAHNLGLPSQPEQALQRALTGTPRPIDLGLLQTSAGRSERSEYFCNTLGVGFDAIGAIHSRKITWMQGFPVYLFAVLRTILLDYKPFRITASIDQQPFEKELLMLIICNGGREGGGFVIAPNFNMRDGLLDYAGVERISRLRMLYTLPFFLKGTQASLKNIYSGQFSKLDLQSDRPLIIHTDGEIFAGLASTVHELSIKTVPAALNVIG